MAFENGHEKVGGRKAGSVNKKTDEMKARLQEFFDKSSENILEDIASLPAKDRLDFLTKLLPYLLPKIAPETDGGDASINLIINRVVGDLDDGD